MIEGLKPLLYDWMGGNETIFRGINSIRGEQYDKAMQLISWASDKEQFPWCLAILSASFTLTILWKLIRRRKGVRTYITVCIGIYIMLGAGFVVNGLVIKTLKETLSFPRPYTILTDQPVPYVKYSQWDSSAKLEKSPVYLLEEQHADKGNQSFPSGHVAYATFLVIALWPLMNTFAMFTGVFFILLVGWSRISLGVHFPADVLGAVLITTPLMVILRATINNFFKKVFKVNF